MLKQKCFFRTRMTFSESLMVTDSTFKILNWTMPVWYSSILRFKSMKLSSLTTFAVCHMQGSGSSSQQDYGSAHTKCASLQHSWFTRWCSNAFWMCEIFNEFYRQFSESASERILKIRSEVTQVSIELGVLLFWDTVHILYRPFMQVSCQILPISSCLY